MFQYATGFALARRTGQMHCLDVSDFEDYHLHQGFELEHVFAISSKLADKEQVRDLLDWRAGKLAKRILSRPFFKGLRGRSFLVEPHFNYWAGMPGLEGDQYLSGYWQSERYFLDAQERIRAEFAFQKPLEGFNAQLASAMAGTTSVSIHVRRGAYLSNPKNHGLMHVAEPAYYQAAISHIVSRVKTPEFYVFSDDMAWVKENIFFDYPCTYISHNIRADSYMDMQLMSKCQHHIIANSSFSWWGAYLNTLSNKFVIAPNLWNRSKLAPQRNIIPQAWMRLSVNG
jgi:hypothetical protein